MIAVNCSSYGKVGFVEIAGELNSANAEAFAQAIEDMLEAEMKAIALDLSGVKLLDIGGLRGLHAGLKRVRRSGGDMRLAGPSAPALESLRASRLDELFTIFETSQAAIASF